MGRTSAARFMPATILTVALFFLWGMANNLNDILIAQFKRAFTLTDFETSFVQQSFYMGYFLLAIPAAMLTRAKGYKTSIVTGLLLYAVGALLFYPAAHYGEYPYFLAALFIIASGLAFLETSANPLMTELGDPHSAAKRLNWAQAANPVGTLAGVLIGKFFILSRIGHSEEVIATMDTVQREAFYRSQVLAVQTPYLIIGLVVFGFAVVAARLPFPAARAPVADATTTPRLAQLFHHHQLIEATVAQFFYVGAQVALWSYTIRYAVHNVPGMAEATAANYLLASLCLFAIGRFIGSALMAVVAPTLLLAVFAGMALLLSFAASQLSGLAGLNALVAASFFLSIQFPTIFAVGVSGLGPLRQLGSSLIIMAIIGGAALTALMGFVSDRVGINVAMLVPAGCFAVVLLFALRARRDGAPATVGESAPLH